MIFWMMCFPLIFFFVGKGFRICTPSTLGEFRLNVEFYQKENKHVFLFVVFFHNIVSLLESKKQTGIKTFRHELK